MDEYTAFHLSNIFRALSDPTRVRLISLILDGEQSVGVLAEQLGMTESAISHQLRGLRLQRIVRARKDGRQVYYSLDDEHVAALFHQGMEHMEHID